MYSLINDMLNFFGLATMPDSFATFLPWFVSVLIGVELALEPEKCRKVWSTLMERGFILNLAYGKTLRLLPPLNIPEADLEAFTETLEDVLRTIA